jgi:hypothetical protein
LSELGRGPRTVTGEPEPRPPAYPVHWKGCIALKKGTSVEVVESDDQWTEIIFKGKHWFTDEQLF